MTRRTYSLFVAAAVMMLAAAVFFPVACTVRFRSPPPAPTQGEPVLTFTASTEPGTPATLPIDPAAVSGVVESERRREGVALPVALVTLTTGQEFLVEDPGRDVLARVRGAR
jgi:hypothetical protein